MEAVEVTRRIGAEELSPVEVVDAVLDRMDRLEPILHALRAAEEAERIKAECNGLARRPRGLGGSLAQRRALGPIRFAKRK